MDVDKLVVQPSSSNHPRQSLRLLCCVWENGRWSYCDLEEQNWMVFGKQSLQRYESNRRHADGVRVENIHKNHNVGPPREDSKSNERPTVWTWVLQWQDHLHVNVQWHCMARKRKQRKMWIQFTDSCGICSQIPSWSLIFRVAWIRREMVRHLYSQTRRIMGSNSTENDSKFLRIWSSTTSGLQCLWERRFTKQKRGQDVNTLQW